MWMDPSGYNGTKHPDKDINKKFEKWLNKGKSNTTVYKGINNGSYDYSGITTQSLSDRLYQHNYKFKKDLGVDFDRFTNLDEITDGLTWNQARTIEQLLIDTNRRTNIINSISPNHRYKKEADEWARKYFESIGLDLKDFI